MLLSACFLEKEGSQDNAALKFCQGVPVVWYFYLLIPVFFLEMWRVTMEKCHLDACETG